MIFSDNPQNNTCVIKTMKKVQASKPLRMQRTPHELIAMYFI